LLLVGGGLLLSVLLAWALEPKRAVGDEPTGRSARLDLSELYPATEAPSMFTRTQGRSQETSNSAASMSRGSPVAEQPRHCTRHSSRRSAEAPARARPGAGAELDHKVSPPEIAEPEATTGLPVATIW
jgi:hypothetical protein